MYRNVRVWCFTVFASFIKNEAKNSEMAEPVDRYIRIYLCPNIRVYQSVRYSALYLKLKKGLGRCARDGSKMVGHKRYINKCFALLLSLIYEGTNHF